jgi:hypothetical protein
LFSKIATILTSSRHNLTFAPAKRPVQEKHGKTISNSNQKLKKERLIDSIFSRSLKESQQNLSIVDYEPPSTEQLEKLIFYVFKNVSLSADGRAIWNSTGQLVNKLPECITPLEFVEKNPVGTEQNLTTLLKGTRLQPEGTLSIKSKSFTTFKISVTDWTRNDPNRTDKVPRAIVDHKNLTEPNSNDSISYMAKESIM